jgi:hypothetical protein
MQHHRQVRRLQADRPAEDALKLRYQQQRDLLLDIFRESLANDPRFSTAWLGGSLGRGDADAVSDVDLTVVVADGYASQLCAQPERATARPPDARLALFAGFGEIAFVSEYNPNAPPGGTSTAVMYAGSGVIVDWTLVPLANAQRPADTHLLFARVDVPPMPPPSLMTQVERAQAASTTLASFWMMAAVTAKYIVRGDGVFVSHWLEELTRFVTDIERYINGQPWTYRRGSLTDLAMTRSEQVAQLRSLSEQAAALTRQVTALGGDVWPSALTGVERWLQLAEARLDPR